jgi:ATP-dependent Lon protease
LSEFCVSPLITILDEFKGESQVDYLESIRESASIAGIKFSWEFDGTNTIHARHIVTDTDWKISLDRGLDIFQHYEMNDIFSVLNRLQEFRSCKAFEVTFLRSK